MRKLPVAVALSAAVHGVAIAWVTTRPEPKHELARPVRQLQIQVVDVEPPPMAVALLDDHTVSALPGTAPTVSHATASRRLQISTGRPRTTVEPPRREP